MLAPSGQFWMVANRHLPYETELSQHFHEVVEAGGTPGFKVIHATRPRRRGR
jgi:16S rRNA (guanine1207-N2)-methyltransferase